jgi:hypothetical protein
MEKKSQNLFKYYKYPTLLDKIRVSLGNLGNLMETQWEHDTNTTKDPFPPPLPPAQKKKKKHWTPHECMLSLLIGCIKLLFPKLFVTVFDLHKPI